MVIQLWQGDIDEKGIVLYIVLYIVFYIFKLLLTCSILLF
jgi:hypothetical protein